MNLSEDDMDIMNHKYGRVVAAQWKRCVTQDEKKKTGGVARIMIGREKGAGASGQVRGLT